MADDILKNIPLPADLPENWTSGQTIAPTGAEVGLDNQYGYNYLMMQVNNAQKALKALAAQREEDLAKIKFWVSPDPTSPASFIGGIWERIEGKFIMGASDTYPAGSTGGSATHVQTISEMPRHSFYVTTIGNEGPKLKMKINFGTQLKSISTIVLPFDAFNNNEITDNGFLGTNTIGESVPINILNPYYSAYIWRRVA